VGRITSEEHDRTREVVLDEWGIPRAARERWIVRREIESDPDLCLQVLAACRAPSRQPRSWLARVLVGLFVTAAGMLSGVLGIALGAVQWGPIQGLVVGVVAALLGGWIARAWLLQEW
jgi:hypothetical protein